MKTKIIYLLFLLLSSSPIFAQQINSGVEMADEFRTSGKIYVVIAVALIILIGIFSYLFVLDRKVNHLEKTLSGTTKD